MSRPTPDALAAAEAEVARLRAERDRREHSAHVAFDLAAFVRVHVPAGLAAADAAVAETRAALDVAADAATAAFDRLAALRSAAAPLVLVPRVLTPDEAAALHEAHWWLTNRREACARSERMLDGARAWLRGERALADLGASSAGALAEAEADVVRAAAELDRNRNLVSDALDARAPLLAAQWEVA